MNENYADPRVEKDSQQAQDSLLENLYDAGVLDARARIQGGGGEMTHKLIILSPRPEKSARLFKRMADAVFPFTEADGGQNSAMQLFMADPVNARGINEQLMGVSFTKAVKKELEDEA